MGIVRNLGMDNVYKVFKLCRKGCFGHCFALASFSLQLAEIWRSLFYFKLLRYYRLYIYFVLTNFGNLDMFALEIPKRFTCFVLRCNFRLKRHRFAGYCILVPMVPPISASLHQSSSRRCFCILVACCTFLVYSSATKLLT